MTTRAHATKSARRLHPDAWVLAGPCSTGGVVASAFRPVEGQLVQQRQLARVHGATSRDAYARLIDALTQLRVAGGAQ